MARGWESKSVEDQMELAETRRAERQAHLNAPTAEEIRLSHERESIELDLTRVRREYQAAQHPRRRQQLQEAIRFLESKLAGLTAG